MFCRSDGTALGTAAADVAGEVIPAGGASALLPQLVALRHAAGPPAPTNRPPEPMNILNARHDRDSNEDQPGNDHGADYHPARAQPQRYGAAGDQERREPQGPREAARDTLEPAVHATAPSQAVPHSGHLPGVARRS